MSGGAYAAGKYLITSTKQISPKVLKALQGKGGPAGKNGANGTNGTPGATGPTGPAGPAGPTGPAGSGAPGPEGKEGAPGGPGKEGSPWTAGGVLPSKATETGTWSDTAHEGELAVSTITFTIPLKEALNTAHVHFLLVGETEETDCKGGSVEKPKASPGNLCVFEGAANGDIEPSKLGAIKDPSKVFTEAPGAGTSGALIFMSPHEESLSGTAWGTWAVTAQ
jgi:hypothetical protein